MDQREFEEVALSKVIWTTNGTFASFGICSDVVGKRIVSEVQVLWIELKPSKEA